MNRDIKFRAWDEHLKLMHDWASLKTWDFAAIESQHDIVHVMQFTGLKDKDGKEIYEGDIVRDTGNEAVREVAWIKNSYGLVTREKYRNVWGAFVSRLPCLKIIGNIYENPELIGK
jgi:hypothetical protein